MNKSWTLPLFCILLPILLALPFGCSSDELAEPSLGFCDSVGLNMLTYNNDLQSITEQKCNDIGCHAAGSPNGDFTTYAGLLPDLDNGKIVNRVLEAQDMPLAGSEELTEEEKEMFQCWLGNGYPEN